MLLYLAMYQIIDIQSWGGGGGKGGARGLGGVNKFAFQALRRLDSSKLAPRSTIFHFSFWKQRSEGFAIEL